MDHNRTESAAFGTCHSVNLANPFLPEAPRPAMATNAAIVDLADAAFIDVHYHANPDAYVRRYNASQAAARYQKLGGWVVLKNHLGCTAAQSLESRQSGLPVSGSIVLNEIAGGIDRRAVERALCQIDDRNGRLIVHLPTVTGRPHRSRLARELSHPILRNNAIKALTVSDDTGRLLDSTLAILRIARDYPIVVSTGHADRGEVYKIIEAALRLNVPRLMLNQPANPMTGLLSHELSDISKNSDIYIEQCALTFLLGYQSEEDFRDVVGNVGNVIYSSDLGQPSQPDIEDWVDLSRRWFIEFELSPDRIDAITRLNPLKMLS